MKYARLILCIALCFALMLPVFAQSPQRLYIVSNGIPQAEILRIVRLLASEFGCSVAYGTQEFARDDDFVLVKKSSLPSEGYQITEDGTLYYADENGLMYGLRHMLRMGKLEAVCEAPDTRERTLMLDCARKYFSKDFICNLIRQMSWMGMNTLELHLTEEQGIRADIWDEKYFESENDFSWICGSQEAYWVYDCPDPDAGKYLTAEELLEIIAVAQQYRIQIIPSVDTPGHNEYLCKVFEAYVAQNPSYTFAYQGKTYQTDSIASNQYSVIDISSEAACAFVRSIMTDYAKFFASYGSTDFNICADEVSLDSAWASGSYSAYDVFVGYINDTAKILQDMGYTVRAFNDFLCYRDAKISLDPNIEIVYWHTPYPSNAADATDFVNQGRTIYNAIQNYSYYALRVFNSPGNSSHPCWGMDARDERNTWWAFSRATPERVFAEWDPSHMYEYTDKNKTIVSNSQLGGSYFLIWCDYAGLATEEEIWSGEYPLLQRLWAHCAKSWDWDAQDYEAWLDYYEYPNLEKCNEAPIMKKVSRVSDGNRLTTVQDVQSFLRFDKKAHDEAYRELLQTGKAVYGSFNRNFP